MAPTPARTAWTAWTPRPARPARPVPLALLVPLLVAGLSGCLAGDGGADPAPEPAADPAGASILEIPWTMAKCRHMVWSATAPDPRVLQARVPPGFVVRSGPGGSASLGMEAFECEAGSGLPGQRIPGLQYGALFVAVDAPDEYGCDGLAGGCYVKTDVLVPDAARRAWLQAAGVAARNGTATVSVDGAGGWTASLVLEGVGGFGMQGVLVGAPTPGADLPFMEFMQADHGVAVWSGRIRDSEQGSGPGAWSADPGTWVEQEVGAVGQTMFTAGTWSFQGLLAVPT